MHNLCRIRDAAGRLVRRAWGSVPKGGVNLVNLVNPV